MSYNISNRGDSNYPVMSQSQWDAAPWNQENLPEKEFNVVCSQTLSKAAAVFTNNYTPGAVDAESEWDGEGYQTVYTREPDDTSNVVWSEEWHDNDHYTPIQLIELFQKFLLDEVNGSNIVNRNTNYLNHLITECNNWEEDKTDYVED